MLNGKLLTQEQFYQCMPSSLRVPHLGLFDTFEEAFNFDININSQLSDKEDNIMEGVVIKPWSSVLYNNYFISRKKVKNLKRNRRLQYNMMTESLK